MAKITNPGRAITLPTGHIVPAGGVMTVTNEVLRCTDNAPTLGGLARSGQIVIDYDAEIMPDGEIVAAVIIEVTPEAKAQAAADDQLAIAAAENAAALAAMEPVAEVAVKKK